MFISASAGPIFASKALTLALIASILSAIPYFLILGREGLRITERRHVTLFFLFWLAVFTFEYYFLGPYSFVEKTTEGNLSVAYNYYLTHGYDGGRFSHEYAGGQDTYTLMFGKQFFNLDRMMLAVFPLWIAIFLHKAFVGTLGFIGSYLLARRMAPESRAAAVAVAALFPVSHYFLLNWSTNWSPGFAVLPLVLYLCIARSHKTRYWPGVFLATAVMTPAEPIHVFPALTVAMIGAFILFETVNLPRAVSSFFLLALCSFVNWHEVLYAFYQNINLASRVQGRAQRAIQDAPGFFDALWNSLSNAGATMWLLGLIGLISLAVLAGKRDRLLPRALLAMAWPFLAYTLGKIFPWQWLSLGFLSTYEYNYVLLSLTAITVPVITRALVTLNIGGETPDPWRRRLKPEVALLAVALAVLTWNKALNLGLLVWFGGQANMFAHDNLNRDDWKPNKDFRVISLFELPTANIVSGMYRLDAFDGQLNINHAGWDGYWFSVVRRDRSIQMTTRAGSKWENWNGRTYDVDGHLRLDLLGIANVRFLLSGLPLESEGLKPVVVPALEDQAKRRPNSFSSQREYLKFRLRRIFDPGKLYVYELPRFLPRVFAATRVERIDREVADVVLHERVAAVAFDGAVVLAKNDAPKFDGLGILKEVRHVKVTDGYDVTVDAPDGGILVLNNMYVPFWEAHAGDGRRLEIVPANAVQMAIAVPPGTETIVVRYRRPLLREKAAGLYLN